ncbi:MAG: hypothetical protein WBG08_05170 [Litorimonas sp.]
MTLRKPEWLDTALGFFGLILAVFSTLALLFDEEYFAREWAVAGALGLGLLVLAIAVLFRPRHSLKRLGPGEAALNIDRALKTTEELIILNPTHDVEMLTPVLKRALENDIPTSVIGDAVLLHGILDGLAVDSQRSFYDAARISGASSNELILCLVRKGRAAMTVFFLSAAGEYSFSLIDKSVVALIASLLKRETYEGTGYIGLSQTTNPREIIAMAREEQRKYLRNFQSLQKGYISFYGNEVQSVQAGWVEGGGFDTIDTLDMTTNPVRLLGRKRYNAANAQFIRDGGAIQRVYMVQAASLDDPDFSGALRDLYAQQTQMGVSIGLVVIDDLPVHYRKDFILYDDSIVLVEDQQASEDYVLGRSTAYFGAQEIGQHRSDFDDVWSGRLTGIRPVEFAERQLGKALPG